MKPRSAGGDDVSTEDLILDTRFGTLTSVAATRAAKGATVVPGWAAKKRSLAKTKHHAGTFDEKG